MNGRCRLSEESSFQYYDKEIKRVSKTTVGSGRIYGRVYVPENWVGKRVLCLLLDDVDTTD